MSEGKFLAQRYPLQISAERLGTNIFSILEYASRELTEIQAFSKSFDFWGTVYCGSLKEYLANDWPEKTDCEFRLVDPSGPPSERDATPDWPLSLLGTVRGLDRLFINSEKLEQLHRAIKKGESGNHLLTYGFEYDRSTGIVTTIDGQTVKLNGLQKPTFEILYENLVNSKNKPISQDIIFTKLNTDSYERQMTKLFKGCVLLGSDKLIVTSKNGHYFLRIAKK